jgi:hypothetical protein
MVENLARSLATADATRVDKVRTISHEVPTAEGVVFGVLQAGRISISKQITPYSKAV